MATIGLKRDSKRRLNVCLEKDTKFKKIEIGHQQHVYSGTMFYVIEKKNTLFTCFNIKLYDIYIFWWVKKVAYWGMSVIKEAIHRFLSFLNFTFILFSPGW